MQDQTDLFSERATSPKNTVEPFKTQLLKWIGNKQRFAHEIASYFPADYGTYFEPFLGSGAVLGTLAPTRAIAGDACAPLAGIWMLLHDEPERLLASYERSWTEFQEDREGTYEVIAPLAATLGMQTYAVPPVVLHGRPVSSTAIRCMARILDTPKMFSTDPTSPLATRSSRSAATRR